MSAETPRQFTPEEIGLLKGHLIVCADCTAGDYCNEGLRLGCGDEPWLRPFRPASLTEPEDGDAPTPAEVARRIAAVNDMGYVALRRKDYDFLLDALAFARRISTAVSEAPFSEAARPTDHGTPR